MSVVYHFVEAAVRWPPCAERRSCVTAPAVTRVGIAMPLYNEERYLPLALDALCEQTYRSFRLVIVDDGSEDGSAAIAEGYRDRIPLTVIRAEHRGLRTTKRAAVEAVPAEAEFILMLDSDVVLPPDAIERMVELLDSDPSVAAVSGQARSVTNRPWGRGQAFFEDLVRQTNMSADGETRWIVGGCVMLRRSAMRGIRMRVDINEDTDLSLRLRDRFRLLQPPDLVASHFGVPTSLRGVWHRGYRDGVRVSALVRAYPAAGYQVGSIARLVPLPLGAATVVGALLLQPWLSAASLAVLGAYAGAFLYASRKVPGDLATRLEATGLFVLSNFGFGLGFIETLLQRREKSQTDVELAEPGRSLQR
jgi:cellulose synthase/poly-beta-1,6-N-acetylglucosamine synthase-like glycosyltransferase